MIHYETAFFRYQFPDIIKAVYIHVLNQTSSYLCQSLDSTGLPPHFAIAIDKSTPHRDTNQAIMVILPFNGHRVSMPIDAPLVYVWRADPDNNTSLINYIDSLKLYMTNSKYIQLTLKQHLFKI